MQLCAALSTRRCNVQLDHAADIRGAAGTRRALSSLGRSGMSELLVEAIDLGVTFRSGSGVLAGGRAVLRAVDRLNLSIAPGEVVGLVGESGSGKTTVGRALLRLLEPAAGTIHFEGADITHLDKSQLRPLRRRMQM